MEQEPEITDDFVGHIIPENDFREHVLSASCWCHPDETPKRGKMRIDGKMISIRGFEHNSADNREHNKIRADQVWRIAVVPTSKD